MTGRGPMIFRPVKAAARRLPGPLRDVVAMEDRDGNHLLLDMPNADAAAFVAAAIDGETRRARRRSRGDSP